MSSKKSCLETINLRGIELTPPQCQPVQAEGIFYLIQRLWPESKSQPVESKGNFSREIRDFL